MSNFITPLSGTVWTQSGNLSLEWTREDSFWGASFDQNEPQVKNPCYFLQAEKLNKIRRNDLYRLYNLYNAFYCPEKKAASIVAARLRPSQFKRDLIVYKISKRAKACLLIHTAKKISHVWYCLAKGYAIIERRWINQRWRGLLITIWPIRVRIDHVQDTYEWKRWLHRFS